MNPRRRLAVLHRAMRTVAAEIQATAKAAVVGRGRAECGCICRRRPECCAGWQTPACSAPAPMTGFAVTPGLREYYLDDDLEELEYAASAEAARSHPAADRCRSGAARRRIVISADVTRVRRDSRRSRSRRGSGDADIPIAWCASIHADECAAEETVTAAAPLIDAADLGDPEAEEKVDDAEGFELLWYATQELETLLAEMSG